ncbi:MULTISPECIES: DUF2147 domain-containing protein [Hymenobacter]|uniref:DUF2147 domain-containing protein n=2 Tax=Hymenobacter TaxID=89966 RepID=A0ABS6WWF5_9BACT|nr:MULTISPECIES: DUF2147 domain-containing protein [Hymenobacter]MBO3269572.1 DUF2147 domain-containing protein [Hymenobacter defluvii]MBW3126930.1 DUF2147 domain-containing protein [Hymenobacter profundi]MBW3127079.1 DUF2147 domain-containing protein [Hymenobacter profundi]QNE39244.1 DUF2147 domain-containing protein [Hymenobacter sp. NBH84]
MPILPRPIASAVPMFSIWLLCLGMLLPLMGQAQALSPVGMWEDDSGEARVEVSVRDGELTGRLIWMHHAIDPKTGQPHLDGRNPNPTLRTRPLQNLVVLYKMRYNPDSGRWEDGEIYDPHSGHYYSCYLHMESRDRLEVKGYIGFSLLGRSHYWHRLKPGTAL